MDSGMPAQRAPDVPRGNTFAFARMGPLLIGANQSRSAFRVREDCGPGWSLNCSLRSAHGERRTSGLGILGSSGCCSLFDRRYLVRARAKFPPAESPTRMMFSSKNRA
jgi:hypothetical protein